MASVGHQVQHKRPWASLGYLVTTLATWAIALAQGLGALISLRGLAWMGRGFRGPLRDYLLADAVEPTHYGRAYGLERVGDMLGAVVGPLVATLLVWGGVEFRTVILWTLIPGVLAAGSLFFLTTERELAIVSDAAQVASPARPPFPRGFWIFLVGVFLFGLGDFSRTFLIWIATQQLDGPLVHEAGTVSVAVLLYTLHNLVSAGVAYPVGHLGDQRAKLPLLLWGYGLDVATNLLLVFLGSSITWLVTVIMLSGSYIAVEEILEKAVAAEMLPRELRSLGFGLLACANAVGDMASSLYVGYFLEAGQPGWAFGLAAACGTVGVLWLTLIRNRFQLGLLV